MNLAQITLENFSLNHIQPTLFKFYETALNWIGEHGLKILLIIGGTYLLRKVVVKSVQNLVHVLLVVDKSVSEEALKKREDTLSRIFSWTSSIAIILTGSLMLLQEIGVPIMPLLTGAGIVGLAVGFGGQYLIRDMISGFFIILENQYRIGDVVNLDGTSGLVEDISLRMTTLRDLNGTVHHIPHGEIKRVSNLSKFFSRVNIDIGISYKSNLEHVIQVVNRVGQEMMQDEFWKEALITPPQFLRVESFSDSAIIIKILGDTKPLRQWEVAGELRKRLKIAFDREGIEIPLPQRVIHQAKS
ncbi:MAG: mechanosensitive ion channel family protein [Cytophagales bacterium]|nr:mechanosensitive ion channel family protein [Cytophagales bacterium]MDW8384648.1 mechanosensitive ion channel family protein [Flammeovirgaceae bacterium]